MQSCPKNKNTLTLHRIRANKTVQQPKQAFKPYLMMFNELGGERGVKRKTAQLSIIISLHRKGKHLKKIVKHCVGGGQSSICKISLFMGLLGT